MQYLTNVTTEQGLVFSQPVQFTASTPIQFISYEHNFQVVPSSSAVMNHFVVVRFSLTEEQAAYFNSGTMFKVQYGDAFDYVVGNIPSDNVIQYQPE